MKRSQRITQQPKSIENPNIIHIKSVILEQSKPSHKLHKAIRQAEKVPQVSDAGKNSNSS